MQRVVGRAPVPVRCPGLRRGGSKLRGLPDCISFSTHCGPEMGLVGGAADRRLCRRGASGRRAPGNRGVRGVAGGQVERRSREEPKQHSRMGRVGDPHRREAQGKERTRRDGPKSCVDTFAVRLWALVLGAWCWTWAWERFSVGSRRPHVAGWLVGLAVCSGPASSSAHHLPTRKNTTTTRSFPSPGPLPARQHQEVCWRQNFRYRCVGDGLGGEESGGGAGEVEEGG